MIHQYLSNSQILLKISLSLILALPNLSFAEQNERLLQCKFGEKNKNSKGVFIKYDSAYPGYIMHGLKNWLLIKANSKNISVLKLNENKKTYSPIAIFKTLSFTAKINEVSTNIRGTLFNNTSPRPYFEAIVINTFNKPYEITYFDSITASVAIGVCREIN